VGGDPPNITVHESVVEQCASLAVLADGAHIEVERTAIRDNGAGIERERASGAVIQDQGSSGLRSQASMRGCTFENNGGLSILVDGSEATVEGTQV